MRQRHHERGRQARRRDRPRADVVFALHVGDSRIDREEERSVSDDRRAAGQDDSRCAADGGREVVRRWDAITVEQAIHRVSHE